MKSGTFGFNPEYAEDSPNLAQLKALDGLALLEFGTPWCGHCQAAMPVVQEAMLTRQGLLHVKVLDGKGKKLGRAFSVKQWPTLILVSNGEEVARLVRPRLLEEMQQFLKAADEALP